MEDARSRNFLGKGFPYPICLDEEKSIRPACEEEKIRQSIYVILMTRQGERPLRPDFGSRIWDYVFDLPDITAKSLLVNEIVQAIQAWEHRVDTVTARIDDRDIMNGRIQITVSYRVSSTNRPDNLVFPFYIEEGQG